MEDNYFSKKLKEISCFVKNSIHGQIIEEPNEEILENAIPEKYDDKIVMHLTLDPALRRQYRKQYGVPLKYDTDKSLEKVISTIGAENWEKIRLELFELYNKYKLMIKNHKKLDKLIKKQRDLACELSTLMREQDLNLYTEGLNKPFDGLIAKYVLTDELVSAISLLPLKYSTNEANDIIFSIIIKTIHTSAYNILPAILDDYADILESGFIDSETQSYLKKFATGKISFKEHIKKNVFEIIRLYWPYERNPNKETALIANLILGLEGSSKITQNDISQMNKVNRKKYSESPYGF